MYFEKPFSQPSVMSAQTHFSRVPNVEIERSTFDRSHAYKTTFNAGKLIPFYVDEVLPGDTHNMDTTAFVRLATPLKPFMDNVYLDIHFFFVPMRLVWEDWQKFMGERVNPDDDPDSYSVPMVEWTPTNFASPYHSLVGGYMGLPLQREETSGDLMVSALPGRAYALIWNEWYRDENLQDSLDVTRGPASSVLDPWYVFDPMPRGKRHDYFTSCLPWPQKGDAVSIPIGDEAIVRGYRPDDTNNWTPFAAYGLQGGGINSPVQIVGGTPAGSGGTPEYHVLNGLDWQDASDEGLFLDPAKQVGIADLSTATSISINDLRTAFQIQRLLERDARGGTRYIELILSHFGVVSSDARLQRPEFLGGGSTRINVNPVASTAVVPDQAPQGNLAGVGTGVNRSGFSKSFEEHGFVIGLMSARADLTYQRTVERFWTRSTRFDFYWPALAHLGEQAVLNKEIWYTGDEAVDNAVFGYQERYAEYRYKPSIVTGLFNSDADGSLDVWHLAQDFANLPVLNSSFIQENPPIDRVIAVPGEPHFLCDIWNNLQSTRPMPVYSVPGLIDHF